MILTSFHDVWKHRFQDSSSDQNSVLSLILAHRIWGRGLIHPFPTVICPNAIHVCGVNTVDFLPPIEWGLHSLDSEGSPAQASEEEQAATGGGLLSQLQNAVGDQQNSPLSHVEDRKRTPACSVMAPAPVPVPVPLSEYLCGITTVAPSPHTAGGQN